MRDFVKKLIRKIANGDFNIKSGGSGIFRLDNSETSFSYGSDSGTIYLDDSIEIELKSEESEAVFKMIKYVMKENKRNAELLVLNKFYTMLGV